LTAKWKSLTALVGEAFLVAILLQNEKLLALLAQFGDLTGGSYCLLNEDSASSLPALVVAE
jgi:hypothetical protein